MAWLSVPVLFLDLSSPMITILTPQRMVCLYTAIGIFLCCFRSACLNILRTFFGCIIRISVHVINTAVRMSSAMPNTFGSPWSTHLVFFSETYLQPVQHQIAVICTCIYQKDKKKLLSMMIAHLVLSCGTLSLH